MTNEIAVELNETATRLDKFAAALESIGPLTILLGVIAALHEAPKTAVGLLIAGTFAVYIAAFLRERAASRRAAAEEQIRTAKTAEEAALRHEVSQQAFVVTEERLATLKRIGAGQDLVMALRNSRNGSPTIDGKPLLESLDQRLGIKRTTESLQLMLGYLTDRRKTDRQRAGPLAEH